MSDLSRRDMAERRTCETTGRPLATLAATVAAGPVFTAMALAPPSSVAGLLIWPMAWFGLSLMFAMVAVAMAAVPVALAVWLGGWLGARWPRLRHPLVWAAVGGSVGTVLVPAAAGTMISVAPHGAGLATGIVIALIARRFVEWID